MDHCDRCGYKMQPVHYYDTDQKRVMVDYYLCEMCGRKYTTDGS